jgi:formate/nitrite transporter FocA (FNT family)
MLIDLGRNLLISYAANAAGAMAFAMLIGGSGLLQSEHGRTAATIAEAKMNLSFELAFIRGILCNALVCIAVWIAGLIFPISAFITLGFGAAVTI